MDVNDSITANSDRVIEAERESPKLEPTVQLRTVASDDIPKLRDKPVDHQRGSQTRSDRNYSSEEESNPCDRPVTETATAGDGQDPLDPNNTEYWYNVNLLARQDIFGYHIWLQSDAAFYYPRLDKYSLSVGMFCATCDVTRRPLGRLATASSSEGNASRHGERALVVSVLGKFLMGQDLSQIYERYH